MVNGWELLVRSGIHYSKFVAGCVQIDADIRQFDALQDFREAVARTTFAEIGETKPAPHRCSFVMYTPDVIWQTDPDLDFGLIYPTARTPEYWLYVRRKQWTDRMLGEFFQASNDLAVAMAKSVHVRAEASNILRRFVRAAVRLDRGMYGYLRRAARTLDPDDLRRLAAEVHSDRDRHRDGEKPELVMEIRGIARAIIGYGGADAVRGDGHPQLVEAVNRIGWDP